MKLRIEHEGFEGRELYLQTPGLFSGARLYLDGERLRKQKGGYVLRDNAGREVVAKLKATPFDPIPRVQIGDRLVRLAEPLKWYDYLWILLPLGLLAVGGALGGGLGAGAAYGNALILRSGRRTATKHLLAGLLTIGAVAVFLAAVVVISLLTGPR